MDVLVAVGLEQRLGVGLVGLVPSDVGTHGMRGQQDDVVAEGLELARPVMSGGAGLEEDGGGGLLPKEGQDATAREAMAFRHPPGAVGDGDLEGGGGDVDGDGSRLHGGLLLPRGEGHGDPGTTMPYESREESIPSLAADERRGSCCWSLSIAANAAGGPPAVGRAWRSPLNRKPLGR